MSRGLILPMLCCLMLGTAVGVSAELVAHWPLDESLDGTTPDESGNGHDLQLGGGIDFVEGYYGQAASFDGQNASADSVHAEADIDLFDPGADSFTATVWVKQSSGDSSEAYEFIVSKGNATSGNLGWSIWTEGGNLLVRCNASNTSAQRASQQLRGWPAAEWGHVAMVIDRQAQQVRGYLNGSDEGWIAGGGGPPSDSLAGWGQIANDVPLAIGHRSDGQGTLLGVADDVRLYAGALTVAEIQAAMNRIGKGQAGDPVPEDEARDILRDSILSWTSGEFAVTHDVYLGTGFADVNEAGRANPMGVLVSEGQDANAYDAGRLEFGQTYYWRVDEVNGAPDDTIFKGQLWSFEVEPFAYPIENASVIASSSMDGASPENTVNGSGLDANDLHSVASSDMWLSSDSAAEPTFIEFAFGRAHKLHEMRVWNYNVMFEAILGYGFKDVTVEYSENGLDWMVLGDFEFAQATARSEYETNTTIDFAGLAVRAVRLTANSHWGTMSSQCGLSEVRFFSIPVQARQPQPAEGQADVDVNTLLSWRAGREAAVHEAYLGTDSEAVSTGAALVDTAGTNSFVPGDLELGVTYYWKIDEVNEAEAVRAWEGDLWSFVTQEYVTIEDFESYDDQDNRIYSTWIDGWINETGSTVGYLEAPFAERTIVNGGRQSVPLQYDNNAAPFYSEAERDLGGADWTAGGADTFRVYVQGSVDNVPGMLYVALEDSAGQVAVVTHPDEAVLTAEAWQEWTIAFDDFSGVDLGAVQMIYIGVGDRDNPTAGGTGLIYVDDIQFGKPIVE